MGPSVGSRRRMHIWIRGLVVVVLIVLGPALGASAHAVVEETDPVDGARLEEAPEHVSVRFSEPVELTEGAIRIFDSSGRRVESGEARPVDSGEVVEVDSGHLPQGTYIVAWRVVSLDGHPIRGAFVFGVGEGEVAVDQGIIDEVLGSQAPARAAGAVVRWVTYLAGLLATGIAVFSAFVLRAFLRVPALGAAVRWAASVAALASVSAIPIFAAEAQATWPEALASSVGLAAFLRVAAMAVLFFSARGSSPAWVAGGASLLVAAELATGHTRTTEPLLVVMAADAVHVAGAAFWLGGLVALLVARRHLREDAERAATVVGRFSALAVRFVLALVIAGLAMAWVQVGGLPALTSTAYGRTLIAKLVAGAAVLGVAVYNNRVLVPRIMSGEGPDLPALERLRSTVRAEVVGLAVVIALTAVLVDLPPAAEAVGGPFSTYVEFDDGELNLVVDPNRAGTNQVHAYVLDAAGSPADVEGAAVLEFHFPAEDIGPIVRQPMYVGTGHWIHTGPELAVAGEWHITFRLGEGFETTAATAVVRVTD